MARASFEKKVLAMTCTDPRLQIVGHATAHVWLRLVMLIRELGTDGVLRFGSGLGFAFGSANEIARLLHIGETEWETELETLVGRGLLQRDASGALELPEQLGMSARAKAARINGLRGGRPRKDGAPPRQRHLLLPMEGGQGEKPMETEHQTQPAAADPKLKLDAEVSLQAQAQLVPDADFHRVGRAAFEAAGFDPAKDMPNYGIVRQWLADRPAWMSVERAEAVIVGAVAEVAGKMRARGNPARHIGAFKSAVAQALRAAEPARDLAAVRAEAAWEAAIQRWWANGRVGPMPELNAYRSDAA